MNKNIAILGGSFNPITLSHVQIAFKTFESDKFDEIWISPCYSNPFKNNLTEGYHRLKMCELAIEGTNLPIKVCDFEIKNKINGGTYVFLKELSKEFVTCNFSYIIGGDQVEALSTWRNYDKLIENFDFVFFNRYGNEIINVDPKIKYTLINERIEPLSSTLFRENFKKEKYEICKYIVDYKVFDYILENKLYLLERKTPTSLVSVDVSDSFL